MGLEESVFVWVRLAKNMCGETVRVVPAVISD